MSHSSSRRVSKALKAAGQERNLGEKSRGPKKERKHFCHFYFSERLVQESHLRRKSILGLGLLLQSLAQHFLGSYSGASQKSSRAAQRQRSREPKRNSGAGHSTKMSERLDWTVTCWRDLPVAASRARDVCSLLVYLDTGSGTCYNGNAHSLLNAWALYTASKFLHGIPTKLIQTPCCTIPWKSRSAPVQDSSAFFARRCSSRRVSVLMSASLHPTAGAKPMLCSNISCTCSTFLQK